MHGVWVSAIPVSDLKAVWLDIVEFLEGAAEKSYGRYTVDDIKKVIMDSSHTLWVAFDGIKPIGAVTTTFSIYPRRTYLDMVFCGGIRLEEWKVPMLALLRRYAKDHNCYGIESVARPGWAKIFASDGHTCLWHTFELPLEEADNG
jgi:hypothetical protein